MGGCYRSEKKGERRSRGEASRASTLLRSEARGEGLEGKGMREVSAPSSGLEVFVHCCASLRQWPEANPTSATGGGKKQQVVDIAASGFKKSGLQSLGWGADFGRGLVGQF
jgi:hypothetical protein